MDPNDILREIDNLVIRHGTFAHFDIWANCEDLQIWLNRGGFEPDWSRYSLGTKAFKHWRS